MLSKYFASLLYRVPAHRDFAKGTVTEMFVKRVQAARLEIDILLENSIIGLDLHYKWAHEIDDFEAKYKNDPSELVIDQIRSPWGIANVTDAIYDMKWTFIKSNGNSYFITSDNPVFVFRCYGLRTQYSEMTVPISTSLMLHCSHNKTHAVNWIDGNQNLVKVLNKRTASAASRLLFYHEDSLWVRGYSKNKPSRDGFISRIDWG